MRALGIFAQAPIPGRVKSRLAEDVGPSTAAEVYGQVGRRVVGRAYLIGLREPQTTLFRGVQWSSAAAQAQLKARAADARLTPHLLRPLRQVETLQDARALGLLAARSNIDGTST